MNPPTAVSGISDFCPRVEFRLLSTGGISDSLCEAAEEGPLLTSL